MRLSLDPFLILFALKSEVVKYSILCFYKMKFIILFRSSMPELIFLSACSINLLRLKSPTEIIDLLFLFGVWFWFKYVETMFIGVCK